MLHSIKQTFSMPNLLKALLVVFISTLLSFSIVIFNVVSGVFWGALLLSISTLLFLVTAKKNYAGEIFIAVFILYFLFWMLNKVTGFPFPSLWQLFLSFFIFGIAAFYHQLRCSKWLKIGFLFFSVFLILSIVSTVLAPTNTGAVIYQFLSNFKPILLLIAGYAIIWNQKVNLVFWKVVNWLWVPLLIMVIFEWAAPGAYFTIFKGKTSPDLSGLFPSRAVGIFMTPSFLAATAAMFILLIYTKLLEMKPSMLSSWLKIAVYFLIILASVQRQELLAVLMAMLLIFILAKPSEVLKRTTISIVLGIATAGIVFWLFYENIMWELPQWGIGNYRALEHPRAQIYDGAFYIVKEYFPLGSGLGTYGGAGANKFDSPIYYQLGFQRYWWFGREEFLMDTYWPNSLAESGVLGALTLLMTFVCLWIHAVTKCLVVNINKQARMFWLFTSGGMLYLLILSFSSPAFQDPMLCFLPLLAFGIASYHEKNS